MPSPKVLEVAIDDLPLKTYVGTKYEETVDPGSVGCERCPFFVDCHEDVVERDGFAWCEDVIAVDLAPGERPMHW